MLDLVIDQRRRDLGGFEVGRVLPWTKRRMVGPFIFFDHIGPADFPAGIAKSVDVRPHPHIGLATVTYLFDGEIMHRDSVGSQQAIHPGEVNWMVAGRGITHSERFEKARTQGDRLHGIQTWVALPKEVEETEPSFAHYGRDELPSVNDNDVWLRLLAGEAFGLKSSAKVHSPTFYAHVAMKAGATHQLPGNYSERAAYIALGSVEADGRGFNRGQLLIFKPGEAVVKALTDTTLMIFGGEPIGERYIEWNFVSSSKQRIEQAKADWHAQRMKLPDLDHDEFIPLPAEPLPIANPLS
jgi:redox-sensitive bicupin YhaK (pirin superfamily)